MEVAGTSGSGNSSCLKSLDEIPQKYRGIFRGYKSFNPVQSKCFDDVFRSDKHIVVGAPTSSGKTVIFELAIIHLLLETEKQNLPLGHFKCVYVAPIKALCKERYFDWEQKFKPFGIVCKEVTGDNDINDINDLENVHLILTTPEKWDALTRKWRDNRNIVDSVKLFMVDEIHLLNEPKRGPSLEAIISRMKTIYDVERIFRGEDISVNSEKNQLRFIAVSATIPNIEDLATWLGHGYPDSIKYFAIPDEMRPVKLKKIVLGYECPPNTTYFRFDMTLNYQLVNVITRYSNGKPTLIFCSTRRGVEMAANVLVTDLPVQFSTEQQQAIIQISNQIVDNKLRTAISKGIAYHHAGLSVNDRTLVENGFRQGHIPVLLCTSTLAMGINLPAHLVIIKSTQSYQQGNADEIPQNTILQMIGRAGRPQFDVSGVAVIMTQQQKKLDYEHLVYGTNPIESHLHKCLAEHLNSEIVLQTIPDLSIAVQWIKSTFFYVRAKRNPTRYGITNKFDKDRLEKKLEEMCLVAINALERNGLITKNNDCVIKSTPYGRLMARYYVNFETIKLFGMLNGGENLPDILNVLTQCAEFSDFKLRTSDKRTLNELNRSNRETIRFQIKGRVMTIPAKISCLMQAVLGNLQIVDISLSQEATKIMQHGERLTKCLFDFLLIKEKEEKCGYFTALFNTAVISKCFEVKLWENSSYVTKQFKRIGAQTATTLAKHGFSTIDAIVKADPRQIETLIKRAPPFGNEIRSEALRYPSYELQLLLLSESSAKVTVFQTNTSCDFQLKSKAFLFVGDNQQNLLFYRDEIKFQSTSGQEIFQSNIKLKEDTEFIICHLVHKTLVGVDKSTTLTIKALNSVSTQKVAKTKRKKTKKETTKKVTEYFKKGKKKNTTENSEDDLDEPVIADDSQFIDESISEDYKKLFAGTGLVNLTSHRSVVDVDETSNDSTSTVVTNHEPQYSIVEILEPHLEQDQIEEELSQMSLSDDETVKEGELLIEGVATQNTVKSCNTMIEEKNRESDIKTTQKSDVLDLLMPEPAPVQRKFALNRPSTSGLQDQISTSSKNDLSKWAFTKPLADFLPKTPPAPTIWTRDEENVMNKAFYGNQPVTKNLPNPQGNHFNFNKVTDNGQTSLGSSQKTTIYDSDVEILDRIDEVDETILQKASKNVQKSVNVPEKPQNSHQTSKLSFISAKTALKRDIIRLGRDPDPVINDTPQKVIKNNDNQSSNVMKVSYLNSFFLGQYQTPVMKEKTEVTTTTPYSFHAKNLSEFRKKLKIHAPNIPLATDSFSLSNENSKMELLDIDEFMNADDPDPLLFSTPCSNQNNANNDESLNLSAISAKVKRNAERQTSDQDYFCQVLSQMCDHPEKVNVVFDPSETWKTFCDDSDYETGEEINQNCENLNEEELKERVKEIETSYFEKFNGQDRNHDEKSFFNIDDIQKSPSMMSDTNVFDDEFSKCFDSEDDSFLYLSPKLAESQEQRKEALLNNFTQYFSGQSKSHDSGIIDEEVEELIKCSEHPKNDRILPEPMLETVIPAETPTKDENIFQKPQFKYGKTLGMRRGRNQFAVPQSSVAPQVQLRVQPTVPAPSLNTQVRYYIPSMQMPVKRPCSIPIVDPFKLRQKSTFSRQPARMRNMETMLEIFNHDRKVANTARNNVSQNNFVNSRSAKVTHSVDPDEELNNLPMFRNVSLNNFIQENTIQTNFSVPKAPPIKLKPQYNPPASYNPNNFSYASYGAFSGYNMPRPKVTVKKPSNIPTIRTQPVSRPVQVKTAEQDIPYWMREPPQKMARVDDFSDFFDDNGGSSSEFMFFN